MPVTNERILSIDIMRGLTLFLMLFVNDLYVPGVPKCLVHTAAEEDGMGLADWVFPGFLFMVGLAIPFAFMARAHKKESTKTIAWHIVIRTLSLLIIGVFMVNASENFNAQLTGMSQNLWAALGYISIFLIWNQYPKNSNVAYLRYLGMVILFVLALIFRGGTSENPAYISIGWWGILGLIGWGYFAASFTYLMLKDHIWPTVLVWLIFLLLNISSELGLTESINSLVPIFGVIISGNVPLIVISGLLIGILLIKFMALPHQFLRIIVPIAFACILLAFFLHQWFIISKIKGTPSWGILCTAISIGVFAVIYYLVDIKQQGKIFDLFKTSGENSLSTYLAPDIVYYLLWSLPFQILIYKQNQSAIFAIAGSLLWAFVMVRFASYLAKKGIRLKL